MATVTIPERIYIDEDRLADAHRLGGLGSYFMRLAKGIKSIEYVRIPAALEKVVPLYDERDNYNPKGRDVDPRFAAGWNAAIDAVNDRMSIERLRASAEYDQGKKDGKASIYRSHTSEDAR